MKIQAYSTIYLQVVLYECKTWSLVLMVEDELRIWEQGIKEDISL